jgi:hypothetical protein
MTIKDFRTFEPVNAYGSRVPINKKVASQEKARDNVSDDDYASMLSRAKEAE